MAESDLNRAWRPGASVDRAEVNRVGEGWAKVPPDTNDRSDPDSHIALSLPVTGPALPPPPQLPEPPSAAPPLSESERRERLASAIETKAEAAAAMQRATEAHRNAMHHEQRCAKRLASFATLPAEVEQYTIDQLRTVGTVELSDALRARISEHTIAMAEHEAARRANEVLLREMASAVDAHKQSEVALTLAVRGVLDVGRDRLREEMAPLETRIAAYKQIISRSDASTTWQPVVERLMSDPLHADLHVDVPDAPEPPPLPPPRVEYKPAVVRIARQVGDTGPELVLTEAEYYASLREASRQPSGAMAKFEAVEAARRQARGI